MPDPPTMMGVLFLDWMSVMTGLASLRYCCASNSSVGLSMPNRWCGACACSCGEGAAVMVSSPR